jgi:hypothetical protein
MAEHYSKHLGVKHSDLVAKGVYNGYLDKDSQLHVDPLLLKGCKTIPEFANAYSEFLQYFQGFIPLVKFVKQTDKSDRFFRKMINRFKLSEIPNTGLGYSIGNTLGRGISEKLATQLAQSAYDIISAGLIEPEIFCLMQLIEDNIGADRISDMTLAILQRNILTFTQRVSVELKLTTHRYIYNGEVFNVPFYKEKPIHFIPMCLLADLPIARDYEDIDKVCNYNKELKRRVADIIGITWQEYKEFKKPDWRKYILGNKDCYDTVVKFYRELSGISYDFNRDEKEQYLDILLEEFLNKFPFVFLNSSYTDVELEVYEFTKAICKQFKHLVEDNRLSEVFYRKNRTPDETDWQMLLYAVADTYRIAGNFDVAITREDNPGVGEIDFHITRGSKANTIIEIKRSSSKDLYHGYRSQLAAYVKADRAKSGIFMIIMEDDSYDTIKNKLSIIQAEMKENGEYIPEVIYINGKRQVSASNRNYCSPIFE